MLTTLLLNDEIEMNFFSKTIICSTLAIAPLFAFAQSVQPSNGPVTRTEVKAQLAAVEKAGYQPSATEARYPAGIQAAEAKVAKQASY